MCVYMHDVWNLHMLFGAHLCSFVCVGVDHMDGSACVLQRKEQGVVFYDHSFYSAYHQFAVSCSPLFLFSFVIG